MSLLHDDYFSVRGKVMASDSWDGLLRDSGGRMSQMVQVGDGHRSMTKSASECFSREFINAHKPDDKHFLVHYIAMGAHEKYGCFFKNEPVRTAQGLKLIQDIVEGDMVLTHKGRYRRVTHTFVRPYSGKVVELAITGVDALTRSTEEHPFFVIDQGEVPHQKIYHGANSKSPLSFRDRATKVFAEATANAYFKAAGDLKKGDWVCIPNACNESLDDDFDIELAWAAGLYAAEGCAIREYRDVSTKGSVRGVIYTLGAHDDAGVIPQLQKIIAAQGNRSAVCKSYTSDEGRRMTWSNKKIAKSLSALVPGLATTKFLSPTVFDKGRRWKLAFIAGWCDGDGKVAKTGKSKGSFNCSTASRSLAYDMQRLLASVGIVSCVSLCWNKAENGCFGSQDFPIYQLGIAGSQTKELLTYCRRLAYVGKHPKAQAKCRIVNGNLWLKINAVRVYEDSDQVYATRFNLEVEEDNSYVTLIAGHNSNRNGDSFVRDELISRHPTFVSNGAYFREHKNNDKKHAIGFIKASAYNKPMARVELLVEGCKTKAASEYEKAKNGDELSGSMACKIAGDRCSCCDKFSKRTSEYCDHARNHMNRYLPEFGKYAFVFNPQPTFIDYSSVERPADRIAHYIAYHFGDGNEMQKAASENKVITSSDWAEYYGQGAVSRSVETALDKLADACKELNDPHAIKCATIKAAFIRDVVYNAQPQELDDADIDGLRRLRPAALWYNLGKRACVLPFKTFCGYLLNKPMAAIAGDAEIKAASAMLKDIPAQLKTACGMEFMKRMLGQFLPCCGVDADSDPEHDDSIDRILDKADDKFSVEPIPVHNRVIHVSVIKHASDITSILLPPDSMASTLALAYGVYKCAALATIEASRGESDGRDLLVAALS